MHMRSIARELERKREKERETERARDRVVGQREMLSIVSVVGARHVLKKRVASNTSRCGKGASCLGRNTLHRTPVDAQKIIIIIIIM